MIAEIEAESRARMRSKSDIVRGRLSRADRSDDGESDSYLAIADLIGSVDGLPPDLGARKKAHLKAAGCGRKRNRRR